MLQCVCRGVQAGRHDGQGECYHPDVTHYISRRLCIESLIEITPDLFLHGQKEDLETNRGASVEETVLIYQILEVWVPLFSRGMRTSEEGR